MVEYPVPHSEVEQAGHNPAFVNAHYRDLRGYSFSVPPDTCARDDRDQGRDWKALIVRTFCDGVAEWPPGAGTSRGVDQIIVPRPAPESRSRRRSKLGLREDGTIRPSVADRRLGGGLPSIGLTRSRPFLTTGGVNKPKGTRRREVLSTPSHSGNLRPRLIGYSGSRRDAMLR